MLNPAGRGLVDEFTELVGETSPDEIGSTAIDAAKRLTLDSLGVAIAGAAQPGIRESRRLVLSWGGASQARIWLSNDRVPSANAAFVNSALVHALDFDDKNYAAGMHVMSTTLPVACAVAEMTQVGGHELLAAIVVGVEVSTQIGEALMDARMDRGFLPASLVGGFGATATAGRLLGLKAEGIRNALGLWYCQASGNRQALIDRSLGKRLQPAFAARSAIWAAELAASGVSGPSGAIDGQAGLFRLYAGIDPPLPSARATNRADWAIESYWIKRYPSCGGCHRPTEAAILLAQEHDIDYSKVDRVVVQVGESSGWHLGAPFELRSDPQVDAQFSIAYSVALGLTRRRASLAEYETDRIVSDTDVLEISRKVEVQILPDTGHLRSDQVEIDLKVMMKDGRVHHRRLKDLLGSPTNPMSFDQVVEKFHECCEFAGASPPDADRVVDAVAHLDRASSVDAMIESLATLGTKLSEGSQPLTPPDVKPLIR